MQFLVCLPALERRHRASRSGQSSCSRIAPGRRVAAPLPHALLAAPGTRPKTASRNRIGRRSTWSPRRTAPADVLPRRGHRVGKYLRGRAVGARDRSRSFLRSPVCRSTHRSELRRRRSRPPACRRPFSHPAPPEGLAKLFPKVRDPCPPRSRKSTASPSPRQPLEPDIFARRRRCRIASAPPPRRRPVPPERGPGAHPEPSSRRGCVRSAPPVSDATKRGRYGSAPDARAHVPKNARAPHIRLTTCWPPPEDDDNPAPDSPKATAHVRTRSARTTGRPKAATDPKARRPRLSADRRAEAHRSA